MTPQAPTATHNIKIELTFAGVNMFLARLGSFWPQPHARVEMRRAKNLFTFKNINSITIIIIPEDIEKEIISSIVSDELTKPIHGV